MRLRPEGYASGSVKGRDARRAQVMPDLFCPLSIAHGGSLGRL